MKRSITTALLACYFLAGSVIFPLSDFSLMRDLPAMYRSYCEVKAGTPDICDFVGDYLLHGKELFGNNAHDAQPKNGGALQFQHQPTLSIFFVEHVFRLFTITSHPIINKPIYNILFYTSEYHHEHFRPPIA
ncbi:hypothetical protein [Mucilaginibacter gilvus]|uniref:Uncharacterized protein n=1 Tax=Mucilaginibacter gilvus TaxID=2305909 RepID=A0A444MJG5_9SPHI|nr:hypothetical protein [Mucilaginibacter gilvus]RWY48374.1 hypothetical protein EPL05_19730 [Mucilaginibacter gilvus]